MLLVLFIACKPPPQAPADYEQLLDYIFAHSGDEDDAELVAGLTNLQMWLDESDTTDLIEGNSISVLSQNSVEELDGDHNLDGLKGVSLLTESGYDSTVLMEALTQYSFKEIMPDVYLTYDRVFDQGKNCIVDKECLMAQGDVFTVADWGILGEVTAQRNIEFRWVELEDEWVFVQRWWLTEPSTGTKLDLRVDNQYYIGVNYANSNGTQRIHASWINMTLSTGDASDSAAQQVIRGWKNDAEGLDLWIDENL
jgi:hypothetical protein